MTVKYNTRGRRDNGEPHTMEQQMLLLVTAAERCWGLWAHKEGKQSAVMGIVPEFDQAMGLLYQQIYQTDVFMGGFAAGEAISVSRPQQTSEAK